MMSTYGLGGGEVIRLQFQDVDWEASTIKAMRPKTGVAFTLPLLPAVAKALAHFLRGGRPRDTPTQHLFVAMRTPFGPLGSSGPIRHIIVKHAKAAGITAPYLGAHVLRHSNAARQVDLGIRPRVLSDLLGHSDSESISAYVRIATETSPGRILAGAKMTVVTAARLAADAKDFLRFKRAMGSPYVRAEFDLEGFVRFVERHWGQDGEVRLQEAVTRWCGRVSGRKPVTVANEFGVVRQLCLYRRRRDLIAFVPEHALAPVKRVDIFPYIFSHEEVRRIIAAASVHHGRFIWAPMLRALILVLYCTGVRLGEAVRLNMADVDLDRGVLTIQRSKGRERIVAIRPDLVEEIQSYLSERRRIVRDRGGRGTGPDISEIRCFATDYRLGVRCYPAPPEGAQDKARHRSHRRPPVRVSTCVRRAPADSLGD